MPCARNWLNVALNTTRISGGHTTKPGAMEGRESMKRGYFIYRHHATHGHHSAHTTHLLVCHGIILERVVAGTVLELVLTMRKVTAVSIWARASVAPLGAEACLAIPWRTRSFVTCPPPATTHTSTFSKSGESVTKLGSREAG